MKVPWHVVLCNQAVVSTPISCTPGGYAALFKINENGFGPHENDMFK